MKLYELTDDYNNALSAMQDDGVDDQTIADTLEGLHGEIEEKARAVAAYLQNIKAESVAMKDADDRIAARRKTIDNQVAKMQDYLRDELTKAGIKKLCTPEFTVGIGKPSKTVEVVDLVKIAAKYLITKTVVTVDKAEIKAAIKAGYDVPGAELQEGKPRLTIK